MFTGFFPAQSNRSDWIWAFEAINDETNAPVDLTGVLVTIAVSDQNHPHSNVLTGSSSDGKVTISTPATGVFIVRFAAAVMADLTDNFYDVGVRFTYPTGEVVQLIKAQLPIIEGVSS